VLADGDGEGDVLGVGEDEVGDDDGDADAEEDPDADGDAAGDSAGAEDSDGVTVAGEDGLRNSDSEGLIAFGMAITGDADDGRGSADARADADAGELAVGVVSGAPAREWACGASECGTAPVRTKTAAADAATSPPVILADATGRETRCRARRTLPPAPA